MRLLSRGLTDVRLFGGFRVCNKVAKPIRLGSAASPLTVEDNQRVPGYQAVSAFSDVSVGPIHYRASEVASAKSTSHTTVQVSVA